MSNMKRVEACLYDIWEGGSTVCQKDDLQFLQTCLKMFEVNYTVKALPDGKYRIEQLET